MSEQLEQEGKKILLSISAGVITSNEPNALPANLRSDADKVQYRAKQRSKETVPRPSVIAVNDETEMTVLEQVAEVG